MSVHVAPVGPVDGRCAGGGCGAQAPSDQPAVDVLVRSYDVRSGVWPTTGWWNSANALIALDRLHDHLRRPPVRLGAREHLHQEALPREATSPTTSSTTPGGGHSRGSAPTTSPATPGTCRPRSATSTSCGATATTCAAAGCGGPLIVSTSTPSPTNCSSRPPPNSAQRLGDAGLGLPRTGGLGVELVRGVRDDQRRTWSTTASSPRPAATTADTVWTYNQGVVLGGLVALARGTGDDSVPPARQGTGGRLHHLRDHPRRRRAHRALRAGRLRRRRPQLQGHLRPLTSASSTARCTITPTAITSPTRQRPPITTTAPRTTSTGCTGPARSRTSAAPPNKARSTC